MFDDDYLFCRKMILFIMRTFFNYAISQRHFFRVSKITRAFPDRIVRLTLLSAIQTKDLAGLENLRGFQLTSAISLWQFAE